MVVVLKSCALPALQLMCRLATWGNSTDSVENGEPNQYGLEPFVLPDGFQNYPEHFAYKVYYERLPLLEAKDRCARDGAQLAVIDNFTKLKYFWDDEGSTPMHAGFISLDGEWVNAVTGSTDMLIPWRPDPRNEGHCVYLDASQPKYGLIAKKCKEVAFFACEIPIKLGDIIIDNKNISTLENN